MCEKRKPAWDSLTGYLSFEKSLGEYLRETEPLRFSFWKNTNGYKIVKKVKL